MNLENALGREGTVKFDKKLIVMVGNIGSGKSTLAKTYIKKGYIIVARDALRYSIGGGNYIFNPKLEPAIWNTEIAMIESFMKTNVNIVIDEVGITRAVRISYMNLAKKYSYHTTALVLPKLTMKESVDRRLKNPHGQSNRKLWEGVWRKFDSKYQSLTYDEGFCVIEEL